MILDTILLNSESVYTCIYFLPGSCWIAYSDNFGLWSTWPSVLIVHATKDDCRCLIAHCLRWTQWWSLWAPRKTGAGGGKDKKSFMGPPQDKRGRGQDEEEQNDSATAGSFNRPWTLYIVYKRSVSGHFCVNLFLEYIYLSYRRLY